MKKFIKYLILVISFLFVGVSLASCNGSEDESDRKNDSDIIPSEPNDLDVYINQSRKFGITYRQIYNINGEIYTPGNLLPTWKNFGDKLNINIREACSFLNEPDAYITERLEKNGYESECIDGEKIDLYYENYTYLLKMGKSGAALNLKNYLDDMPNFKAWLNDNPAMAKELMVDDNIYYVPFFDGYNAIEKMFIMDTSITKAVLDAASFDSFDDTISGKGAADNTLQESRYTPFINPDFNYSADIKLSVLDDTQVREITVKKTDNIIKQQNELLANGTTGKALAQQFRSYLDAAYGEYVGKGKLYENYSDIFVSEAAAYNVDEMIALFRVVKANPGVITGDNNKEVEIFTPRGISSTYVVNITDILQLWGVNGMTSEKDMLYFTPDGKLADATTTQGTYDALKYLSAMYSEGLIIDDFFKVSDESDDSYYLDKYFARTTGNEYALILYDSSTETSIVNDKVNGIGTDKAQRYDSNESVQGVMPILPPYTYWATESTWKTEQKLTDFTGKTLTRYYGENRGFTTRGWCIPSTSDNITDALKLMDYMFTEEGSNIQNYGPEEYWSNVSTTIIPGEEIPVYTDEFYSLLSNFTDYYTFMRSFIGSAHSIGSVRSKGMDLYSNNFYAQNGLINVQKAIAMGVVNLSMYDKYSNGSLSWDSSVPINGYPEITSASMSTYEAISRFWRASLSISNGDGWVAYIIEDGCADNNTTLGIIDTGEYDYNDVISQIEAKKSTYLATYQNYLDNN